MRKNNEFLGFGVFISYTNVSVYDYSVESVFNANAKSFDGLRDYDLFTPRRKTEFSN